MTIEKKSYESYGDVLTDMKVKISGHIDFIKRLKSDILRLLGDIYNEQEMSEMAYKIKKGHARVFREKHKDLIQAYKQKDIKLGSDLTKTGIIEPRFKVDEDLSPDDKKDEGRKNIIHYVLESSGDYHTREEISYKDIYGKNKENKGRIYQDINSGEQLFTWDAIQELGLVKDLPSKRDIELIRTQYGSRDDLAVRFILGELNIWDKGFIEKGRRNEDCLFKSGFVKIFLSNGSSLNIYPIGEYGGEQEQDKYFEYHEKNEDLKACPVFTMHKDKDNFELMQ